MTENLHPLSESRAAELWDAHRDTSVADLFRLYDSRYKRHQIAVIRAAFDAGREHEREHADPHHDPRTWQECTVKDIRKGDLVETQIEDCLHIGVAHHQDAGGDWHTEDGYFLTNGTDWPLRRIPSATVTAEEVELPAEFGAVITDVEADFGEPFRFDRMVWTGRRWAFWGYSTTAEHITAFTLPDGTHARRDGEDSDGRPRFVKEADQ